MVRTTKRRGQRVWVIDFSYITPDGRKRRYRRDAEVQTRAGALAEARRRLAAVAAKGSPFAIVDETAAKIEAENAPPPAAGPTFAEVVDTYRQVFMPSRLKASSQIHYREILDKYLLPQIGKRPLVEITSVFVTESDAELAKAGKSRALRRRVQVVLRSVVCRHAVEAGYLTEPPRMPKMPRKSKKIPEVLTSEQAMAIIEAARRPEQRLALMLAFHAGLRSCEIRGLRVCDVDLVARVLRVRQAVSYGVVDTPKSGHDREVPLTGALHEALATALAGRPRESLVSISGKGKPWGQYALREVFHRNAKRAGIEGSTMHHLRHGFVTALLDHGVGAHIVKELAGHADLTTTERYAHAARINKRAAIDALDGLASDKKGGLTSDEKDGLADDKKKE
jgi:integrase